MKQNNFGEIFWRMTQKRITWRSLLLSCYFQAKKNPKNNKINDVAKQQSSSFQRLSLSDVSDPSWPVSADDLSNSVIGSKLHAFTFAELKIITHNFSRSNMLGEGGFGPVYKGFVDDKIKPGLKAQPVAVKALDLDGKQGHREWMVIQ